MADGRSDEHIGDAEYPDVSKWGDKDVSGAYADGTKVMIGGTEYDLASIPDVIGGAAPAAQDSK
jgi:hypothetical protein